MSLLSYECVFIHFLAYHRRGIGGCQGKKISFGRRNFFCRRRKLLGDDVGAWIFNAFLVSDFRVK